MARGSDGTGQADHPRAAGAQSQSHGDPVASESQGRDHAGAPAASRPGTGGVSSRRAATPAAEAGGADPATPRSAAKGPTVQADIDAGSGGNGVPLGSGGGAGVTGIAFPRAGHHHGFARGHVPLGPWVIRPRRISISCGARSEIGSPYCEHHAQIALSACKTVAARRRLPAAEGACRDRFRKGVAFTGANAPRKAGSHVAMQHGIFRFASRSQFRPCPADFSKKTTRARCGRSKT